MIGIIVLISALFATLVRILLPDFGMYRSEVEAWVSNYMDLPVAIHSMSADWVGWTPHLRLEKIDLMDSTGTVPILLIENANISINVTASLINRQIIPQELVISGLDMTISRLSDGSINIQGLNSENNTNIVQNNNELDNWLLNQNTIKIENANIEWHDDFHEQPPLPLTNVNLQLNSSGEKLSVKGNTTLPTTYGRDMEFAIQAEGDLLSSDWSAEVYIKASEIKPENWHKEFWPDFISLTDGNVSISITSQFENAKIKSLAGDLIAKNFVLYSKNKRIAEIHDFDTTFSGITDNYTTWTFDVKLNKLITENGDWPLSTVTVSANDIYNTEEQKIQVDFDYLRVQDLSTVISSILFTTNNYLDEISGELTHGTIIYDATASDDDKFSINTNVQNLSSGLTRLEPVLTEISAYISGGINKGTLRFRDSPAKIIHSAGEDPVFLDGDIEWHKPENHYVINSDGLSLKNDKINASIDWNLSLNDLPQVELNAFIKDSKLIDVINYMPYTTSFRARDWLKRSIKDGLLLEFGLSLSGNPKDFPFVKDAGEFDAFANVKGMNLEFSDRYPSITNISSNIQFQGQEMFMNIDAGKIVDADITAASAYISNLYLREKLLSISGNINGEVQNLINYIDNSPLKNNVMISTINDTLLPVGNLKLKLDMDIPIRLPGQNVVLKGSLNLDKAAIQSKEANLALTNINGEIDFTESSLNADTLTATYDASPVALSIKGSKYFANNPPSITLSGKADQEFITQQLNKFIPHLNSTVKKISNNITGSTNWKASIIYSSGSDEKNMQRQLVVTTDLIGLEMNSPTPLAKKDYESAPLFLTRSLGAPDDKDITLNIGDLNSNFKFNEDKQSLSHIFLTTAKDYSPSHMPPGIYISGSYDTINVEGIFSLLRNSDDNTAVTPGLPVNIDIHADNLSYFGQQFNDISVTGKNNEDQNWEYILESNEVKGKLNISRMQNNEKHIIADFDHLHLTSSMGNNKSDLDPSSLPVIFANIDDFTYNEMVLGNLSITALPTEIGLHIEDISFKKPNLQIQAKGKWNKNRYTGNLSNFFINVHSNEFNEILRTFKFENQFMSNAETNLTVDANWPGAPSEFSLDKLNGTIDLDIGNGHLLDIQPAAGRLFGLLSLQTLPRRMLLDFSDLFGEGMAFDSINGNFSVNEGNAYTDNLVMRGPAVKIDINGRAGLAAQDYDQIAIVTPQISDSLAVASGFLGPVGIGLGTVLYLAGNMFEPLQDSINQIMKVEYSIKGSWNDPVIERENIDKDT